MTRQQMPITRVDLAERGHDAYVSSALDQHIFTLTDWVDLPKDHQKAFRAGVDAILDALIQEAVKRDISISYFGETEVTEKNGTTRTVVGFADGHLDTWLKSFKDQP